MSREPLGEALGDIRLQRVVNIGVPRLNLSCGGGDPVREQGLTCRSSTQRAVVNINTRVFMQGVSSDIAGLHGPPAGELLLQGEIERFDVSTYVILFIRKQAAG